MERIFNAGPETSVFSGVEPYEDEDTYQAFVRAMISDAVDYEESFLGPLREQNQNYYYGNLPSLVPYGEEGLPYNSESAVPDDSELQQSSVVSTDVRDTVMSIMPTLMRTFAAANHVVMYVPNTSEQTDMAAQATEYVDYKFWEQNNGFLLLHGALKDCLTVKLGVLTWWTDNNYEVSEKQFANLQVDVIKALLAQAEEAKMQPEVIEMTPPDELGMVANITIRYVKSKPSLKVEGVAPDEFRISRRAKTVQDADVVGRQLVVRASDIIAKGFDKDMVHEYVGASYAYNEERSLRNNAADTFDPIGDLVDYGEYYIRIDSDGDGINELHRIKTLGNNYDIIEDVIVNGVNYALFQSDPRSHTAIGDCPADLVLEIQDIKTNILRSSLDSLAETLNPRTAINETLTNVEDALSTERGALIRTRGNPGDAVKTLVTEFVGAAGFEMLAQIDQVRQARTGISEASKGMDPKALQSTNVMGVDAIITGAQERIELIARILAETGFKDLYKGLLREITDNPNPVEVLELNGKWTDVKPSLFDADMRVSVNPSLGKGSDATRLATLAEIRNVQTMVLEKYGLTNPIVGVGEFLNTITDMLALANIKNTSRYFKPLTPEAEKAIMTAPKEPDAATMLAMAEVESNKKDIVIETAKVEQANAKMDMEDNFRRDELAVNSYLELASIFKDLALAEQQRETIGEMNDPTE